MKIDEMSHDELVVMAALAQAQELGLYPAGVRGGYVHSPIVAMRRLIAEKQRLLDEIAAMQEKDALQDALAMVSP